MVYTRKLKKDVTKNRAQEAGIGLLRPFSHEYILLNFLRNRTPILQEDTQYARTQAKMIFVQIKKIHYNSFLM